MDLIDRAKLINIIKNELAYQEKHATPGEDIDTGIICGLRQAVEIVKGIEPEAEKTGIWLKAQYPFEKCSVCGAYFDTSSNQANYCCVCGARMEG